MIPHVPKPFLYVGVTVAFIALIPPALIIRARGATSGKPRIHMIQDMDNQHRINVQAASPSVGGAPLFADGRGMRLPVPGTVARGELALDDHHERGLVGGTWAEGFPRRVPVTPALLERGRERFNIYCAPCHGESGHGDGIVHHRAMELLNSPALANGTTWVAPKSLHEPAIVDQPVGQIFNTITNGVRNMAGYADQVALDDRWAIVAYVKALQRSRRAQPGDYDPAELAPPVERPIGGAAGQEGS